MRVESPNRATTVIVEGRAIKLDGTGHETNRNPIIGVAYKGADIGEKAIIDTDEFTRATVGEAVVPGDELTAFTDGKFFKASNGECVSYIAWENAEADKEDVLLQKKDYTK